MCYRKSKEYKLVGYCDVDYPGDRLERKSTSRSCKLLGDNLVWWSSKRQSAIALSTTEDEYIATSGCNTQMLSMKSRLEDFQIHDTNIHILCDNTSAIYLSKNLILHSGTKHILIKHPFIRDYVHKGI